MINSRAGTAKAKAKDNPLGEGKNCKKNLLGQSVDTKIIILEKNYGIIFIKIHQSLPLRINTITILVLISISHIHEVKII
jgi:hypothetical protein